MLASTVNELHCSVKSMFAPLGSPFFSQRVIRGACSRVSFAVIGMCGPRARVSKCMRYNMRRIFVHDAALGTGHLSAAGPEKNVQMLHRCSQRKKEGAVPLRSPVIADSQRPRMKFARNWNVFRSKIIRGTPNTEQQLRLHTLLFDVAFFARKLRRNKNLLCRCCSSQFLMLWSCWVHRCAIAASQRHLQTVNELIHEVNSGDFAVSFLCNSGTFTLHKVWL